MSIKLQHLAAINDKPRAVIRSHPERFNDVSLPQFSAKIYNKNKTRNKIRGLLRLLTQLMIAQAGQ